MGHPGRRPGPRLPPKPAPRAEPPEIQAMRARLAEIERRLRAIEADDRRRLARLLLEHRDADVGPEGLRAQVREIIRKSAR